SALHAQEARARVQGLVTDSSSAVIVGANVTLVNLKTGVKMVRPTNETGLYRFDYVDPGTYTITIEAAGFSRFSQETFDIQAQADRNQLQGSLSSELRRGAGSHRLEERRRRRHWPQRRRHHQSRHESGHQRVARQSLLDRPEPVAKRRHRSHHGHSDQGSQ